MKWKWIYRSVLALSLATMLVACGNREKQEDKSASSEGTKQETSQQATGGKVGISFPSDRDKAMVEEAENIKSNLEGKGYSVTLEYAGDDRKNQADQLEAMLEEKVAALVICPLDSETLIEPLEKAGNMGIPVVSYSNLIAGSEDVSYYVGFDYSSIGKSIGGFIVENQKLDGLKKNKETRTIEFFMGALNDYNSRLEMEGILDVLEPYIEDDVLQIASLRTTFEDASIANASGEIAKETCTAILQANYMTEPVDIICAGTDDLATQVAASLTENGIEDHDWPTLTGCGGTKEAFQRMKDGKQGMTVFTQRDNLPQLCANLVDDAIVGNEIQGLTDIDNGVDKIPSIIGKSKIAYIDNYQEVASDAGVTLD